MVTTLRRKKLLAFRDYVPDTSVIIFFVALRNLRSSDQRLKFSSG